MRGGGVGGKKNVDDDAVDDSKSAGDYCSRCEIRRCKVGIQLSNDKLTHKPLPRREITRVDKEHPVRQ